MSTGICKLTYVGVMKKAILKKPLLRVRSVHSMHVKGRVDKNVLNNAQKVLGAHKGTSVFDKARLKDFDCRAIKSRFL